MQEFINEILQYFDQTELEGAYEYISFAYNGLISDLRNEGVSPNYVANRIFLAEYGEEIFEED